MCQDGYNAALTQVIMPERSVSAHVEERGVISGSESVCVYKEENVNFMFQNKP